MAEGSYEYECNRAELLGIEPPNRADFEAAFKVRQEEIENELANVSVLCSTKKMFHTNVFSSLFIKGSGNNRRTDKQYEWKT